MHIYAYICIHMHLSLAYSIKRYFLFHNNIQFLLCTLIIYVNYIETFGHPRVIISLFMCYFFNAS